MTIKETHDIIKLRLDKDRVGFLSPGEIDDALDRAQMSHFMRLYSNPKEYQRGKPARYAAFHTQKIHDDLAPFKKRKEYNDQNYTALNPSGTGPDGIIVLPSDYIHGLSLMGRTVQLSELHSDAFSAGSGSFSTDSLEEGKSYRVFVSFIGLSGTADFQLKHSTLEVVPMQTISTVSNNYYYVATATSGSWTYSSTKAFSIWVYEYDVQSRFELEVLAEDQIGARLSSTYLAPSSTEPIVRQVEGSGLVNNMSTTNLRMQIFPEAGTHCELQYLRRPAQPEYVFTMSGETETHDAASSTDMEWNDEAMGEIIEEAIQLLAQNLNDQVGLSVAASKKGEGV